MVKEFIQRRSNASSVAVPCDPFRCYLTILPEGAAVDTHIYHTAVNVCGIPSVEAYIRLVNDITAALPLDAATTTALLLCPGMPSATTLEYSRSLTPRQWFCTSMGDVMGIGRFVPCEGDAGAIASPVEGILAMELLHFVDAMEGTGPRTAPRTRIPERTSLNDTYQKRLRVPDPGVADDSEDESSPTCCICLSAPPTTMFSPCQHQCACRDCAVEVMERDDQKKTCPLCRAPIEDIFRPIV